MYLIIPLIPVSKKNSQRILINRKNGRPFIMPSEKYKQYEKKCGAYLPELVLPIEKQVNIKCLFYMPTRRTCDLVNLLESVDDILVKYKIIKDDNYNIVVGHDGSRVRYDKENPRTEITITEVEDETF